MKRILYCLVFLYHFTGVAQTESLIADNGIATDFHRANLGKIFFTDQDVPVSSIAAGSGLQRYTLTNRSDLFITAFMDCSITNAGHRLAPLLPMDQLALHSNYQLTLMIDGYVIYSSNLWPGAPRGDTRNKETILTKPLIDNANPGAYWSQSFWNRFILHGGDSVLTDGPHRLRMEIRAYVDTPVVMLSGLIAAGDLELNVKRVPVVDLQAIHLTELTAYPGIPVSTDFLRTDSIKKMKAYIDAGIYKNITSVVVLKNGRLLLEEYFNGIGRDSMHDVRSVGKSFTSTLMGIAIGEGRILSIGQPLSDFYKLDQFQHPSSQKGAATLHQLMTMSSAFDGDDNSDRSPGNEENMYPAENWLRFALDLPVDSNLFHGQWHYFTAGMIVLGDILDKHVPGGLEKYAKLKLFDPLGIRRVQWEYTPQGVVNTAGGIQMNTLDFAKYGLLYQNNGRWNGRQVLSAQWVKKTFTRYQAIPGRPNEYYGYLFWNKTFMVNGRSYEAFYCAGNGGNSIFVFRDVPLVIVVTATAYGAPYAHPQVHRLLSEYLLPSIMERPPGGKSH